MRELEYDREATVAYARRWALDRNPLYYDFENIGGDCTAFVSQCLYAGAHVMNFTPVYGWYYLSPGDRTASWTGVEYFYNFITENASAGPYGSVVDVSAADIGDIVQLGRYNGDFYHSLIIVETEPRILVVAHSYDVLDRPLSAYDYDVARFIHIEGVRGW